MFKKKPIQFYNENITWEMAFSYTNTQYSKVKLQLRRILKNTCGKRKKNLIKD